MLPRACQAAAHRGLDGAGCGRLRRLRHSRELVQARGTRERQLVAVNGNPDRLEVRRSFAGLFISKGCSLRPQRRALGRRRAQRPQLGARILLLPRLVELHLLDEAA